MLDAFELETSQLGVTRFDARILRDQRVDFTEQHAATAARWVEQEVRDVSVSGRVDVQEALVRRDHILRPRLFRKRSIIRPKKKGLLSKGSEKYEVHLLDEGV